MTEQERRVLIAILLALVIGVAVRFWRRQGEEGMLNVEQEISKVSR
ncbi:MAG: hypothetical protein L3J39_14260 [Verrucomicrobiales bacterium]|nr:hypothetical protein [Verrucomicrobiales bacterium]